MTHIRVARKQVHVSRNWTSVSKKQTSVPINSKSVVMKVPPDVASRGGESPTLSPTGARPPLPFSVNRFCLYIALACA